MTKRILLSSLLGGLVMFIWGAISWTALPWHHWTFNSFKDSAQVSQIIKTNTSQSGMYLLNTEPTAENPQSTAKPLVFASVFQPGMSSSMGPYLIGGLIIQIIAAFLVSLLLNMTRGLSYAARVGFVVLFGLAAFVSTELPYWNWFHFSTSYTLVSLLDLLIEWFLGGLVIAKIIKR